MFGEAAQRVVGWFSCGDASEKPLGGNMKSAETGSVIELLKENKRLIAELAAYKANARSADALEEQFERKDARIAALEAALQFISDGHCKRAGAWSPESIAGTALRIDTPPCKYCGRRPVTVCTDERMCCPRCDHSAPETPAEPADCGGCGGTGYVSTGIDEMPTERCSRCGGLGTVQKRTAETPVKHEPKIRHHDMECHCSCGGPWPCPETGAKL